MRRLFGLLHCHTARWPAAVKAVAAPIQVAHLKLLEHELRTSRSATVEGLLRSTLLPNEAWSDTERWRSNERLLAWLRMQVLAAQPSTARCLPLARAALRSRLQNPSLPPPSLQEARALFELEHPSGRDRQPALSRATLRADSEAAATASGDRADASTRGYAFADVLEECGGLVKKRGAWGAYCEEHATYELITCELIDALATHVAEAAERRASGIPGPPTVATDGDEGQEGELRVLECGAGNGELSHYLRAALRARGVSASLTAIDNGSSAVPSEASFDDVERLSVSAALRLYTPHLVIVSWMPMGVDWSAAFRTSPSLNEYLLLGECYDGACGHNWTTWGNPAFAPEVAVGQPNAAEPPHVADGWSMREVPAISKWMLSRFSSDVEDCEWNSCAVSFRRGA